MSKAPPKLPTNVTRQQLTHVEVKHGIKLRMRYKITRPGRYEVVLVGKGTNVEISVNNSPPVVIDTLEQSTDHNSGPGKAIVLPETLSVGTTELTLSVNATYLAAASQSFISPSVQGSEEESLSISEMWLTPRL